MMIPENTLVNILLADDHSLIRQGVELLIEDLDFKSKIFHASNLQEILKIIDQNTIDIAIIDANFPDGNSLNILPQIKNSYFSIKVLVFSGIDEQTQAYKFFQAGANGFLSKLSDADVILEAINNIHFKGEYFSEITKRILLENIRNPSANNPLVNLTPRELEIAKHYCNGLGNLEIANLLEVKQNTISTIKKRIFEKLEIDNIVHLINIFNNHN